MANETRVGAPVTAVGGLRRGPLGTPLPTDASKALDAALKAVGLVGEDGLSESEDRKGDDKRAWSGTIARTVQQEYGLQVTFTLIERTEEALKVVHGDGNVTVQKTGTTELRTILHNSKVLPRCVWVAEIKDENTKIRKVYPIAQVTEVGEVQYSHSELITYEVTLTAYEDEAGQHEYEYEENQVPETV